MFTVGLSPAREAIAAPASAQALGWLHAAHPDARPLAVHEQILSLPFTGKVVHRLKVVEPPSVVAGEATSRSVAFTDDGAELPDAGEGLQAAEWQAEWSARGGVRPALWQRLASAVAGERIPVAIWLRVDEPPMPPRAEFGNPYALETDRADRARVHGEAKSALAAEAAPLIKTVLKDQPGVPVFIADLTKEEVLALAWSPRVGWMDWLRPTEPQLNRISWYDTALASPSLTGQYGSGKNVCVLEDSAPQHPTTNDPLSGWPNSPPSLENWADQLDDGVSGATDHCLDAQFRNSPAGQHSRAVIGALQTGNTPGGFTPTAHLLLANYHFQNLAVATGWCQSYAANGPAYIWNSSNSCDTDGLCPALMDYYSSHPPWPLITIPTGYVASGDMIVRDLAWNPLTVGGTDDFGDSNRSNDIVDPNSPGLNPVIGTGYTDFELPQVVAPSHDQISDGQTDYSAGTSLSSAQVAGIAAQVLTTNLDMQTWPEPIRALIICSADQDVDTKAGQFSLQDGIDDRGGAGEVNGLLAVQMAASANRHNVDVTAQWRGYNFGSLRNAPLCDPVNGCYPDSVPAGATWNHYYHLKWDPNVAGNPNLTNPKMRVVLTWDAHASCTNVGAPNTSCASDTSHYIDADIDMYVYRDSDNAMVAYSTMPTSNWEFVEFVPEPGASYTVKFRIGSGWWAPMTYYGIAWNTATYASK